MGIREKYGAVDGKTASSGTWWVCPDEDGTPEKDREAFLIRHASSYNPEFRHSVLKDPERAKAWQLASSLLSPGLASSLRDKALKTASQDEAAQKQLRTAFDSRLSTELLFGNNFPLESMPLLVDILSEVLIRDWRNIKDDRTGEPLAFSAENVRAFVADAPALVPELIQFALNPANFRKRPAPDLKRLEKNS